MFVAFKKFSFSLSLALSLSLSLSPPPTPSQVPDSNSKHDRKIAQASLATDWLGQVFSLLSPPSPIPCSCDYFPRHF